MDDRLTTYLKTEGLESRLALLRAGLAIPQSIGSRLLEAPLVAQEKALILTNMNFPGWSEIQRELFFIRSFLGASQEMMIAALAAWEACQSHALAPVFLELAREATLPQRVTYSLLASQAFPFKHALVETLAADPLLNDYSEAFHGLILATGLTHGNTCLTPLATDIVSRLSGEPFSGHKAASSACLYLAATEPKAARKFAAAMDAGSPWRHILERFSEAAPPTQAIPSLDAKALRAQVRPLLGDETDTFVALAQGLVAGDDQKGASLVDCLAPVLLPEPRAPQDDDPFWEELAEAQKTPREDRLDQLAQLARTKPHVLQFAYIRTLGYFQQSERATLKLLDFIRSPQLDVIHAVIEALGAIGGPRATMELVAMLTRPNSNLDHKGQVLDLLAEADLKSHQAELRSAHHDMSVSEGYRENPQLRELVQGLADLLDAPAGDPAVPLPASGANKDLEAQLGKRIPEYGHLSSEVKRALRTAIFFHMQVEAAGHKETIDLSPAIDMQYKALELLFRELFEEPAFQVIREGMLQKKLDIIGYARPIPQNMDQFENYIAHLPVVDSIAFFSKFKLRKMLRAICQYRPGRRFTLDGLKAFGLFFLVFSRKKCTYGLNNHFPISALTDQELYQFTKELHEFQDFRNRAAHEGFHPDKSNDLDAIWKMSARIVTTAFRVKSALLDLSQLTANQGVARASEKSSAVIIERKPKRSAS